MSNKTNAFTFLLFLLASSCCYSQSKPAQAIDSLLEINVPRAFNGIVIISKNGTEIYKRSHGYSDLSKKTLLKFDDQFIIASLSKQITAALVLRQVEAGNINLSRTIKTYLPDFAESWADSVTIKQLLSHTSGIYSFNKHLKSLPGSNFAYSNINYVILGKIIEKTAKKPYAVLTKDLFTQCGMSHTSVPPINKSIFNLQLIDQLVKGYNENENHKLEEETNILDLLNLPVMGIPAAGIISTAGDLVKWNEHLHEGKLLKDSTYQMMIKKSAIRPHRWGLMNYGYGIQIDSIDHIKEINNAGYVTGFIATNIYYPASKISIVILENVSPEPSNMNRVYFFHDQIRNICRTQFRL